MAFMFPSPFAKWKSMDARTSDFIYLDANATEPLRPEARAAMLAALDITGNPSSIHAAGRAAWNILETARKTVATHFAAKPEDVVFTSGGTEANATAIAGLAPGRHVLFGATEHDAVRAPAQRLAHTVLPVLPTGQIDLAALKAALASHPKTLVCLMLANNETGILHPIAEAAALCHAHGALLHVDAVQAAGRIPCEAPSLGADSLAVSGHKLGGPKGAGALILTAATQHLVSLIQGGGQERGRRGGTPGLPAIAGFAAALKASTGGTHLAPLRDRLEAAAIASGAIVCGGGPRLPNTTCLARPGQRADTQVIKLDLAGIAVSAGAACSSGKVASSHVLMAMGLTELAGCAIRISLPWNASDTDIDTFLQAYRAPRQNMEAA
jgi:cysteine desulfurase